MINKVQATAVVSLVHAAFAPPLLVTGSFLVLDLGLVHLSSFLLCICAFSPSSSVVLGGAASVAGNSNLLSSLKPEGKLSEGKCLMKGCGQACGTGSRA